MSDISQNQAKKASGSHDRAGKAGGVLSRRRFIGSAAGATMAACGLAGVGGCQDGVSTTGSRRSYKYRPLDNWPKLPAGMELGSCTGIDIDRRDRLFVAGGSDDPIIILDRHGKYLGGWGKGVIENKHSVRIHNGRAWVTDRGRHQVFEFTLDGKMLQSFGTRGELGTGLEQFNKPSDIAFGADGTMYISDGYGNTRVMVFNADGTFRKTWGTAGTAAGEFNLPHNIAIDAAGRVYVADRGNARIQVFGPDGEFLKQWNHLGTPCGLFLSDEQVLFSTDGKDQRVYVLDLEGNILSQFGADSGLEGFELTHSVVLDSYGALYVTDAAGMKIRKFVPVA